MVTKKNKLIYLYICAKRNLILFFVLYLVSKLAGSELADVYWYLKFIFIFSLVTDLGRLGQLIFYKGNFPRATWLGFLLSHHVFWSFLFDAAFTYVSIMVIGQLFDFTQFVLVSYESLRLLSILGLFVFINRFFLANVSIRFLKRINGLGFNIVLLRRFSESYSFVPRQILGPILGAYGHVLTINDKYLDEADRGINADSEEVLSELGVTIVANDSNWKSLVKETIKMSGCIVFYWPEVPNKNLLWEYKYCKQLNISDENFLFIIHDTESDKISELLNNNKNNNSYKFIIISSLELRNNIRNVKKQVRLEVFKYFFKRKKEFLIKILNKREIV